MDSVYKKSPCGRSAFSLVELLIAMGLGFGLIAATFSAYIFITRNGKSLESQVSFNDIYRSLHAEYTEVIEESRNVEADSDDRGITVTFLDESTIWIGYVEGADAESSKIVIRPNGRSSASEEQVLCKFASPVYYEGGNEIPMFMICGHSAILNVHIGDRQGAADTTGPGYQGIVASIAASSRNLRRKL